MSEMLSSDAPFEDLLKCFQETTGIEDAKLCLRYLVLHNWELNNAVNEALEHGKEHSKCEQPSTATSQMDVVPDGKTTRIQIRCGDRTIRRRFSLDDTLECLFRFGEDNGLRNCVYKLTTTIPNKFLELIDKDKTLRELNFCAQESIAVEFENKEQNITPCIKKEVAVDERHYASVVWYKRADITFDWTAMFNTRSLENAYLKFISDNRQNCVEFYFDDCRDYVVVDFAKMIVTKKSASGKDKKTVYHLKRKNLLEDIPMGWNWDGSSSNEYQLVDLDCNSTEFANVSGAVYASAALGISVEKIERVENPMKYKQYQLLKQKLELLNKNRPDIIVERHLFHGTKWSNVGGICSNGFNRSLCGQHGTAYGAGTYFAANFTMSSTFGTSHVFYASVLAGRFTGGNPAMRVAPDYDSSRNIKYDSVVDRIDRPNIFVVFSDNHAYPSYLITYRRKQPFNNNMASQQQQQQQQNVQTTSTPAAPLISTTFVNLPSQPLGFNLALPGFANLPQYQFAAVPPAALALNSFVGPPGQTTGSVFPAGSSVFGATAGFSPQQNVGNNVSQSSFVKR